MKALSLVRAQKTMIALSQKWGKLMGALGLLLLVGFMVVPPLRQAAVDLQLLYRVQDELLSKTPQGQHYIELFYGHGAELTRLLQADAALRDEGFAVIELWQSNLQALVDGKGSNAIITRRQVQAVIRFLDHLSAAASPELREVILAERKSKPLEAMLGLTMDQAYKVLTGFTVDETRERPSNYPSIMPPEFAGFTPTVPPQEVGGYTLAWLPPLSADTAYEVEVGARIPIAFTVRNIDGDSLPGHAAVLTMIDANGNVVNGPTGIGEVRMDLPGFQGKMYYQEFDSTGSPIGCYFLVASADLANPSLSLGPSAQLCLKNAP